MSEVLFDEKAFLEAIRLCALSHLIDTEHNRKVLSRLVQLYESMHITTMLTDPEMVEVVAKSIYDAPLHENDDTPAILTWNEYKENGGSPSMYYEEAKAALSAIARRIGGE